MAADQRGPTIHEGLHEARRPALSAGHLAASADVGRRALLAATALVAGLGSLLLLPGPGVAAPRTAAACRAAFAPFLVQPDFAGPGPLEVGRLPRREHTCTSCFPALPSPACTMRVEVVYPRKGGAELGLGPPYPLAVFSAGFLLGSDTVLGYAERLASWGYTCLLYDRNETVASLLDDASCVRLLVELLDYADSDPLMKRLADTRLGVFMLGHSRGGKLAALVGAEDARVAALCLLDPVDNTVYAPLKPGFPSALAALRNMPRERRLPLAVVGGGLGGDCAPRQSNYRRFFAASTAPCWEVAIPDAGHFQFLNSLSGLQRAVCPTGEVEEEAIRGVGQAVMVAWAESMIRHRGADIFGLPVPYPSACQQQSPLPTPTPLQAAQLAQLQQRQGLRGQASLAQAAYAAAWVQAQSQQQEPQPQQLELQAPAGAGGSEGADGPAGGGGGSGGEFSQLSSGQTTAMPLPPAGAAASSRIGPNSDRRESGSSSDPSGSGSWLAVPPASGPGRAVVAQEALMSGLDRLITRLAYEGGLSGLTTRYKNFDGTMRARDDDEGPATSGAVAKWG